MPLSIQPPPHEIAMFTERNWSPLADIASSVTGATRRKLSGPGRTVRSTSSLISARQKTPRTWSIDGLWFDDVQGQARADQMRMFLENGLAAFEIVTDRYLNQVELGMTVEVESYPRHGLDMGFGGVLAGWREQPSKGRVALTVIGASLLNAAELREDGTFEFREDGSIELRE